MVGLGAIGKSEGILANERFVKQGGAVDNSEVVLANEKAVGVWLNSHLICTFGNKSIKNDIFEWK